MNSHSWQYPCLDHQGKCAYLAYTVFVSCVLYIISEVMLSVLSEGGTS